MEHLLIPGVQYRQKSDVRPEVTPVRSDGEQRFRYGAEEHIVCRALWTGTSGNGDSCKSCTR